MRVKIIVYLTITTHWGKHIHFQPDFRPLCTFLLPHRVWKSPNMSHLSFSILAFSTNFCPTKIDLSGNTVWPQASRFQKHAKLTIFGLFNLLLSIHNINVARFFRNVVWDFFFIIFKHCVATVICFSEKKLPWRSLSIEEGLDFFLISFEWCQNGFSDRMVSALIRDGLMMGRFGHTLELSKMIFWGEGRGGGRGCF